MTTQADPFSRSKSGIQMSQDNAPPPHYLELDGVRGILANVVMLFHLGLNTLVAKVTGGVIVAAPWGICVDFFFILSGFVLANAMTRRPKSLPQFFVSRVFRLLPLHLCILLAMAPLYAVAIPIGAQEFALNAVGLAVFTGTPIWNMASWSMHLELYVPLLFFSYRWMLTRHGERSAVLLAAAGGSLALQCWTSHQLAIGQEHPVLRALGGLSLGYFLFNLTKETVGQKLPALSSSVPLLTTLYLALVLVAGLQPLVAAFLPILSLMIIQAGVSSKSFLSRGPFRLMGELSYPVYMLHAPILFVTLTFLPKLDGSALYKLALIVGIWCSAFASMHLIERPGMAIGRAIVACLCAKRPEQSSN